MLSEKFLLNFFGVGNSATGLFWYGRFCCWTFLIWDFLAPGLMNCTAICTVSYGLSTYLLCNNNTFSDDSCHCPRSIRMHPYLWLNHACNRDKYNPQDMLFIWDIVVSGDLITSFKKTHLVNEKHEWFFHSLQIWPQKIVSEKELFNLTCYPKYIQTRLLRTPY